MSLEGLNAASTAFAAVAAIAAAFAAGLSVYEARRVDARARRREASQYDDALQTRLDAMMLDLRQVMGTPDDGVPEEIRETLMRFFVLYSDAFAADRDNLLGTSDNASMLDEFDFWAQQPAGRSAWEVFEAYSWPEGFKEHVEMTFLDTSPYTVDMKAATLPWKVDVREATATHWNDSPKDSTAQPATPGKARLSEPLQCAEVLLRIRRLDREFPPSRLDKDLSGPTTLEEQRTRRAIFADWLRQSEADLRLLAMMGERAVGYVEVGPPADYLRSRLSVDTTLGPDPSEVLEIRHLFVDPDLRGKGTGQQLLDTATAYIRDAGKTPILVVLPASEPAIHLYKGSGWVQTGQFDGTQGVNLVFVGPSIWSSSSTRDSRARG